MSKDMWQLLVRNRGEFQPRKDRTKNDGVILNLLRFDLEMMQYIIEFEDLWDFLNIYAEMIGALTVFLVFMKGKY